MFDDTGAALGMIVSVALKSPHLQEIEVFTDEMCHWWSTSGMERGNQTGQAVLPASCPGLALCVFIREVPAVECPACVVVGHRNR